MPNQLYESITPRCETPHNIRIWRRLKSAIEILRKVPMTFSRLCPSAPLNTAPCVRNKLLSLHIKGLVPTRV